MNETPSPGLPPEAPPLPLNQPKPVKIFIPADTSEDEQSQQEQHQARVESAVAAAPFVFKGMQLAPFTPSREAAFHEHREALNAIEFSQALTSARSFMADIGRMLYFLTHQPSEWLLFLAQQDKGKWSQPSGSPKPSWTPVNAHALLEEEIQAWADTVLTGSIDERTALYNLCMDILTRASSTMAQPVDSGGGDLGN